MSIQALFLHEDLLLSSLGSKGRAWLAAEVKRRQAVAFAGDEYARRTAFEDAGSRLLKGAVELGVAVFSGSLSAGQLVTLTQNFYIRRDNDARGSFKVGLDSNRAVNVIGRFSTSRLIGSTGLTETFGHRRFTMLAYVGDHDLEGTQPFVDLRPVFIGWRLQETGQSGFAWRDDTRELNDAWVDALAARESRSRPSSAARSRLAELTVLERGVGLAAALAGHQISHAVDGTDLVIPLVYRDQVLSTALVLLDASGGSALRVADLKELVDLAFWFGRQDVRVVGLQRNTPIAADVRNLLAAFARQYSKH